MDKVQKAIVHLIHNNPFFAELLCMARRIEGKNNLPPDALMMVTTKNGRIIYYTDEELYVDMSVEQVARGVQHELMHIIFEHGSRCQGRDPDHWNIAGDLAINSIIPGMDIGLIPGKGFFQSFPSQKTAETYYDMLPSPTHKTPNPLGTQGNNPSAQGNQGNPGSSNPQGSGNPQGGDGGESCSGCGSSTATTPLSDFDKEVIKGCVKDAAEAAKGRGNLPSNLEIIINEFLGPSTVDWRTLLKRFVAASIRAGVRTTYLRENKKQLPIKGRLKDRTIDIALAIDTSGSVVCDQKLLTQFLSEIQSLAQIHKADILVLECDAAVHKTYKLHPKKRPEMSIKGGGGTSFVPVFDWLKEKKKSPDLLIYLTDLEGVFPDKQYFRTLWVAPESLVGFNVKPPFGKVIRIKEVK